MGRSRGGLTTRIHAPAGVTGRPVRLRLTEGETHEGRSVAGLFETVRAGCVLPAAPVTVMRYA